MLMCLLTQKHLIIITLPTPAYTETSQQYVNEKKAQGCKTNPSPPHSRQVKSIQIEFSMVLAYFSFALKYNFYLPPQTITLSQQIIRQLFLGAICYKSVYITKNERSLLIPFRLFC